MIEKIKRHREIILVIILGLVIFSLLNLMMLQMNYDRWTTLKLGPYTAFKKGWELSGFDVNTYVAIATGRPLFIMMRHPLIMYFIWPLWQLHEVLADWLRMNCAIHIVAVVWTLMSTAAWTILYSIMRRLMALSWLPSLLLTMFCFSFSHVMLATFVPDHMIITMLLLLITVYLAAKARQQGRALSTWKALLLCFLSTGISTTNCAKIWLVDMLSQSPVIAFTKKEWWRKTIIHTILYLLPLAAVGGIYYYDTQHSIAEEERYAKEMEDRLKEREPEKWKEMRRNFDKKEKANQAKQICQGKLFQWTDVTVPLDSTIVENFFGEGLQLHDEYTLLDCHGADHRPDIVTYSHWYNYLVEAAIVLLFFVGMWCGRREPLMWMTLSVFLCDVFLHLVLRFALSDIYIMTAHWAMVIPIAIGYLYKKVRSTTPLRIALLTVVALLTLWLWYHNATLTYDYIVNVVVKG